MTERLLYYSGVTLWCLPGSSFLLCMSVITWQTSWLFQRRFVKDSSCSFVFVCLFICCPKHLFLPQQLKNKKGLIPSNFVEEVAVASPRRLAAAKVSHVHDPASVTLLKSVQPVISSFFSLCFKHMETCCVITGAQLKSCCRHQTNSCY